MDTNKIFEVSKRMKIRYNCAMLLGRAITYKQIDLLTKRELIDIMIHSRSHFLAIETSKLLKMPLETFS